MAGSGPVRAVAAVVSLIYLAYQIRQNTSQIDQNTKAVQASAIDSSVGHAMGTRQAIFESADVARILRSGYSDPNGTRTHSPRMISLNTA